MHILLCLLHIYPIVFNTHNKSGEKYPFSYRSTSNVLYRLPTLTPAFCCENSPNLRTYSYLTTTKQAHTRQETTLGSKESM